MRTPVIPLLLSALLGAGLGYALGSRGGELPSAPNVASDQDSDNAALLAQIASLEDERDQLRDELRRLEEATDREPATLARTQTSAPEERSAGSRNQPLRAAPAPWRSREIPIAQRKIMVRQRNGALFRELGLSETQIDALLGVLGEQDARSPRMARRIGGPAVGRYRSGADSLSPEERQRDQDEIAAVIGREKAAQFEALEKTLPARSELQSLRNELELAGEPISDEQQKQLLAIMSKRDSQPPSRVEGEPPEQAIARYREWRRERSEGLRQDAASVLTPDQLKRMEEADSLRSSRQARMASNGAAPPAGMVPGAAGGGAAPPPAN